VFFSLFPHDTDILLVPGEKKEKKNSLQSGHSVFQNACPGQRKTSTWNMPSSYTRKFQLVLYAFLKENEMLLLYICPPRCQKLLHFTVVFFPSEIFLLAYFSCSMDAKARQTYPDTGLQNMVLPEHMPTVNHVVSPIPM
jgi:hypothetical protein